MRRARRHKAPSRVRYELNNPTVSCRVTREIYDQLALILKEEHKSFADILKIGLGIVEAKRQAEAEINKKAYSAGHRKGYEEAERLYRVTYPCRRCGGIIVVRTPDEKKDIAAYMRTHGWRHEDCLKGR